jgi:hypothetical protein
MNHVENMPIPEWLTVEHVEQLSEQMKDCPFMFAGYAVEDGKAFRMEFELFDAITDRYNMDDDGFIITE